MCSLFLAARIYQVSAIIRNCNKNAPSQINERQSSHDTCTLVAAEGVVEVAEAVVAKVEPAEHGPPPPPPPA